MDLSVIITSYNTKHLTVDCIKSVFGKTKDINYEVIVVDNASTDGSLNALRKLQKTNTKLLVIENKENLGFAEGNNVGVKRAKGKFILLLNSDTKITSNVLAGTLRVMEKNPKIGVFSCGLKNKDGTFQANGGYFPSLLRVLVWMTYLDNIPGFSEMLTSYHPDLSFYKKKHMLDWVTGAYFLTRKEIWDKVGGLDKKYFMYVEDSDFCFRVKKSGLDVIYDPSFSIIHYGGASSKTSFPLISEFKGLRLFYKKYYPAWKTLALRIMLKGGAAMRMFTLSLFKGPKFFQIYKDAFDTA